MNFFLLGQMVALEHFDRWHNLKQSNSMDWVHWIRIEVIWSFSLYDINIQLLEQFGAHDEDPYNQWFETWHDPTVDIDFSSL